MDGKTQIQIIVKNGETFTAPVLDGIGKPGDYTEGYFQWLGNDGQLYAPGDSVPATVDTLTAQFAPSSSVTITTDTLPDGKVDEAYSQTLTANGTTPIIWSIENGSLPAGLSLDKDTGEISGTPTADGTAKFTVKAENCAGSDMKELSITIDKAEPPVHEHTYSNWIADGETDHYRVCTDENCTSADKAGKRKHTAMTIMQIRPAMFAAMSALSHHPPTSTPTATGLPMVKPATTASAQMKIAPLRTRGNGSTPL